MRREGGKSLSSLLTRRYQRKDLRLFVERETREL
jgi:hypothetical protein